ncbi:MAG: hypothetical protein K5Q68_22060 [Roseococcus sp.]|nr:hypothetical protein [Roseococcus sp.]
MTVQADRTRWTLVARGGALRAGEHVEKFSHETDAYVRLSALLREAREAGEPLVNRIIPPSTGARR